MIPGPQADPSPKAPQFFEMENGALKVNMNAPQGVMLQSPKRRVVFVAGTRAGKTSSGIFWLYLTMRKMGPGDYLVVAPTMSVLSRGAEREIQKVFERYLGLGYFRSYPRRFVISDQGYKILFRGTPWENQPGVLPTTIYLVHATDPNALEAITAKACWADEAGQDDFKVESYEAIERRLSIDLGPMLITTTPYNMGWLKRRLIDPWDTAKRVGQSHPIIDVIQARSIDNPAFPEEEYWRQKEVMPHWRWDMMYNANFSIPSGLVYDCVPELEESLKVAPFEIPAHWPRYVGIDFGGVNLAALFGAVDPDSGLIYLYRYYHPGVSLSKSQHARLIQQGEPFLDRLNGGAGSEGDERLEFLPYGLAISEPKLRLVEAGISRAYGIFSSGRVRIFAGDERPNPHDLAANKMHEFWNEIYDYRYETDPETGLPLPEQKIVNQNSYHSMDCARYLFDLFPEASGRFIAQGFSRAELGPQNPDSPDFGDTLSSAIESARHQSPFVRVSSARSVAHRISGPPPRELGRLFSRPRH